ncbi:hypothetical protein D3C85_1775520 [compost metagenome]
MELGSVEEHRCAETLQQLAGKLLGVEIVVRADRQINELGTADPGHNIATVGMALQAICKLA